MIKKNLIILIIFCTAVSTQIFCQQIIDINQSIFNNYIFNPAIAGCDSLSSIDAISRQLWSGLNDAPNEKLISAQLPMNGNMGIGSKIFNMETGPVDRKAHV